MNKYSHEIKRKPIQNSAARAATTRQTSTYSMPHREENNNSRLESDFRQNRSEKLKTISEKKVQPQQKKDDFFSAPSQKKSVIDDGIPVIRNKNLDNQVITSRQVKEDKKEDKTTKVIVDIKGMVVNPGVYEVDSTSRVNDVISLAGGLLEGADTSKINLAKVVEDEMTIIIYSTEEVLEKFREENCVCEKCNITNDACISSTATDNQLININTADEKELQNINGVGEAKAKAIIEYREENGLFTTIEDIKNVPGIGDSLFEKIKTYITI